MTKWSPIFGRTNLLNAKCCFMRCIIYEVYYYSLRWESRPMQDSEQAAESSGPDSRGRSTRTPHQIRQQQILQDQLHVFSKPPTERKPQQI